MTLHITRAVALVAVCVLVATTSAQLPLLPPPGQPTVDPPNQPELGVSVVDRGPIHEAFAQPGADVRGKGMTAPKAPPPPIPELPPDTKPDGNNVKWIPGYWAWDEDKQDFIWISGFYRDVPPGRDWQPGKWIEKGGKWMYTPGWWRPVDLNRWRVDLPEPPPTVERGPSAPATDPNAVWIPGAWEFRNEQYVWRPGYWAVPNGDMIWQPPQYVTTGSGFTYVPGYWDYPLEDRGLLFAPVCFSQPLWLTPGWCFRPSLALGIGWDGGWGCGGFFNSLFISPGFNYFCFGNYFSPGLSWGLWTGCFSNPLWCGSFGLAVAWGGCGWGGYRPWCMPAPGFCNPTWNNYCWLNRNNPGWAANVQRAYVGRAAGVVPQPVAVAARANRSAQPLRVAPPGIVGAAQRAIHSTVASAQPQPLIQPAREVAKSLQTNRSATDRTRTGDMNRGGTGAAMNPKPATGGGAAMNPKPSAPRQTPPVHVGADPAPGRGPDAGALRITPGGAVANNSVNPAGGINSVRPPDRGAIPRDTGTKFDPSSVIRPNPGAMVRPDPSPVIRSDPAPVIRSNPGSSIRPDRAPTLPPVGSGVPAWGGATRSAVPSTPAIRPSAPLAPAIRPGPINSSGGTRGPIGGAGGGARPGGAGGARSGGKR